MPGGVCAVLDYDVDVMADYVSEMSTRLVANPNQTQPAPAFRKFVQQILTSTRLPRTTILLGMNYLAKRINMLRATGSDNYVGEGQIWRMLTIALLLGSKFLDDNTFQNRSWSEVSGLAVSELNSLEFQWLGSIGWHLYVNLDQSKDYNAWLHNWQDWLKERQAKQQVQRDRLASLAPINTDVRPRKNHIQLWTPQEQVDFDRVSRLKRSEYVSQPAYRPRDSWQGQYQQPQNPWHHPLTPPDSAYGTPEYPTTDPSPAHARYNDWFAQAAATTNMPTTYQTSNPSAYQSSRPISTNYSSYYANSQQYGHQFYDHGVLDCNCANCLPGRHQQPYIMAHRSYGQPVAS